MDGKIVVELQHTYDHSLQLLQGLICSSHHRRNVSDSYFIRIPTHRMTKALAQSLYDLCHKYPDLCIYESIDSESESPSAERIVIVDTIEHYNELCAEDGADQIKLVRGPGWALEK